MYRQWMRWGVGLICVAACGGETGVDLEIRSDVAIESVEIFIANRSCTETDPSTDKEVPCREELGWLDGQAPVVGAIYEIHNEDFDKQKHELRLSPTASGDGSTYTVRLVAEGEIGETHMIAIVGLDGAGKARALAVIDREIPENSGERWLVTLAATDPANADQSAPRGSDTDRRATVWGRDGTAEQVAGSRCLVMQEWTGDDWKSKFIVPASDHDCDGHVLPAKECDAQYYHLNEQRPAACAAVRPLENGAAGACTVGLSRCRDGTTNDPGCLLPARMTLGAPEICVPDKICELCDGPYGVVPCAQAALQRGSDVGHATCRLYGSASDGSACGPGKSGSVAKLHLPFSQCSAFEVRPLAMPLLPTQSTEFTVQQGDFNFAVNAADQCTVALNFVSGKIENGSNEWIILGVYPRLGDQAVMLIPIQIEFAGGGTDCNGGLVPEDCGTSSLEMDNIKACGL